MADGSPQATVVWVDTDGEHVIFNTAEGRVKTENLRRDPRVAVSIFNPERPYDKVNIRGKVVDMIHEGAVDHVNSMAKKYMGVDVYPGLAANPDEKRVIIKIAPV
jgi:PPOX class probable F420-dependent enzyme